VLLDYDIADKQEAYRQAESDGYKIISAKSKLNLFKKQTFSLILFSQELLALLNAGLSLLEAIETLAEKESRPEAKKIYTEIIRRLHEGKSLSDVMQRMPAIFPSLYTATVRASEKTGDLKEALSRYLAYQGQIDVIKRKVVNASIYPALLMAVGGAVIVFLLAYVVPKFSRIYEDLNNNLPWLSRLLMEWGKLFESHWLSISILGMMSLGALLYGLTRPAIQQKIIQKLFELPAVGERMRVYQLARFYRTTGMLLRGGVPAVTALNMVSGLLIQSHLRSNLDLAKQYIEEGQTISQAFHEQGLTTEVAFRMLRVGERSGNLGEMMERIAAFYDDDIARWVDWVTRLFEPLLMVLIGLIIGIIVILMYMPILELAGSIQ
jgi:general secretion pathway protein F